MELFVLQVLKYVFATPLVQRVSVCVAKILLKEIL